MTEPTTAKLSADVLEAWWTFAAKADDATAGALAGKLDTLRKAKPADADAAFRFIAGELAKQSTQNRCTMSTVLAFWLVNATGFLRATAEVASAHPTSQPDRTAEHLDPARAKRPEPVARVDAAPAEREVRRELLEALDLAGADPQTLDLVELEHRVEGVSGVGTHAALAQLITSVRFSRLQQLAAGKNPLAPVCAMIARLVLALTDGSGPARQDPLTASAIASLDKLLDVVVECVATPSVALRAIDLMMDEIGIVVAVAKNYLPSDYAAAARKILLERAPGIRKLVDQHIEVTSHLVCGGMDALGTALWIALSTRDHRDVARPTGLVDYYETGNLLDQLKKGEAVVPRQDVLVAALNPSTPFTQPDAAKLVADVLEGLQTRAKDALPFALILDTTIQIAPRAREASQLDVVLTGLSEPIAEGQLEVFLCKSYQKYASFGFGKVAAGDLTLLSQKGGPDTSDARYRVLEQKIALGLDRNDESQLVVHMLKHGHDHELSLIRSAADNARFVDAFCWPAHGIRSLGSPCAEGIPLLLRSTPGDVNSPLKAFTLIDWRNSFSFLRTSFVGGIDLPFGPEGAGVKYVRFNTGHELKAAMVEFFYAFGHLANGLLPGADLPNHRAIDLDKLTVDDIHHHLAALGAIPHHDKADKNPVSELNRYRNNIIAFYCVCAVQLVKGRPFAKVPLLIGFFNQSTSGVTLDTQRLLADTLLSLAKPADVATDATLISALCRAAAVVPSAKFAPFARQVPLGGLGTTEAAKRLTAIIERTKVLVPQKK